MRLVWRPAARRDRGAIFDFIETDNPRAALEMDERFWRASIRLSERPEIGRKGRTRGTREFVVHPNYILIYRIKADEDVLEILNVKHAAQKGP